jgi:Family of unknown function (DUF6460)
MSNGYVTRLLGGTPAAVVVRLIVVSFVVGLILVMFGFEPENIYDELLGLGRRLIDFGLTDFRQFGRVLLTGAMVVLPVWLVLRLLDARKAR